MEKKLVALIASLIGASLSCIIGIILYTSGVIPYFWPWLIGAVLGVIPSFFISLLILRDD